MKTISQTLDNYASDPKKVIFRYRNWNELMEYNNAESITIHIHNVMQEYATEAIKADRELITKSSKVRTVATPLGDYYEVDKQSILNLPIELK